jgi:hypothetical protein
MPAASGPRDARHEPLQPRWCRVALPGTQRESGQSLRSSDIVGAERTQAPPAIVVTAAGACGEPTENAVLNRAFRLDQEVEQLVRRYGW